ncbi:hypothetical protein [Mycobacterium riyadhense]|uniref:hypothetical protein n=1 Tax=Mycobacterium riyadhense TaxID=486698 RepID=UPI0027E2267C|nr:hypothetical protein [Mycobacterium riyadhense]
MGGAGVENAGGTGGTGGIGGIGGKGGSGARAASAGTADSAARVVYSGRWARRAMAAPVASGMSPDLVAPGVPVASAELGATRPARPAHQGTARRRWRRRWHRRRRRRGHLATHVGHTAHPQLAIPGSLPEVC